VGCVDPSWAEKNCLFQGADEGNSASETTGEKIFSGLIISCSRMYFNSFELACPEDSSTPSIEKLTLDCPTTGTPMLRIDVTNTTAHNRFQINAALLASLDFLSLIDTG